MKTPTIEQQTEVVVIPRKRTFLSLLLCFAIALSVSALNAQTTVGYLQPHWAKNSPFTIPPDPQAGVGAGYYGPFNLPGYGDVWVNVKPDPGYAVVPKLTWGHQTRAQFQQTSNHLLNWGTDTDFFHFDNTSNTTNHYTIAFSFAGLNLPNPSDLFLVVYGLAKGT